MNFSGDSSTKLTTPKEVAQLIDGLEAKKAPGSDSWTSSTHRNLKALFLL
jgi:hypothetical protein